MKPPIKAIKKIIKFCYNNDIWDCDECELARFCKDKFVGCPASWKNDYKKLKKEVKENE